MIRESIWPNEMEREKAVAHLFITALDDILRE